MTGIVRFVSVLWFVAGGNVERHAIVHLPRAMMQRDMIAVDVMRGDRVFRRMHKSGRKMGCPYIEREKNRPPLKPQETELAGTHGHLFRKKVDSA